MRAVIIEDEPHAQMELKRLLNKVSPEISVVTCLDSIADAVDWLRSNEDFDFLFLDIELSDGISFNIFKQVQIKKPVIFTTAYNAYAIQAFELNSVGYLLKPIAEKALSQSIQKLKNWENKEVHGQTLSEEQWKSLMKLTQPEFKSRIMVKSGDQLQAISVLDVAYFYAEENVVFMVTKTNKRHLVETTLDELGKRLNPAHFFRLNRKFLVHIDAVGKARKYFNSRLKIDLLPVPEGEVLVSRARVSAFMDWMEQ